MNQPLIHDANGELAGALALAVVLLAAASFIAIMPDRPRHIVLTKACEQCEFVVHSVHPTRAEALANAPRGAFVVEVPR